LWGSDACEEQGDVFFAMPLLCFDNCPEKRDESNPHTIGISWLQFIPFFGTLQSSLFKGHMAKKDIPLFPAKKTLPCSCVFSFSGEMEAR
jgi:hypothetical protein